MDDKSLRSQLEGLFSDLEEAIRMEEGWPAFLEKAVVEDFTERQRAEEALRQREAILEAIAFAAETFLRPGDWEQNIQAVLANLGQAANVNRVSLWEASPSDRGHYLLSARYEWIAPQAGLTPLVGLQNLPMFRRWRDILPHGGIIAGHVRDFGDREQEFFVPRDIKSVLAVPVFVGGTWWGFMGFDQGRTEREWTEAEIDALKTAASILGGALERKQMEKALVEERNLLRTLIDSLPDRVYVKDTEGRFIIGNVASAQRMGVSSPDDLLGKTDFDFLPPELAARFHADEQAVIQSGQPLINHEEPMDDPINPTRWNLATKVPLRDSQGKIIGVVGIGREITERKAMEEALRASEERFALAVQGANDGIWDWDIQNNTLYWSPRLKELLGYAPDELEVDFGTFESFLHPDDREPTQAAIEAHLKERVPFNIEQRLRTKSGEYRWFNARGQAVWDQDGRPIRMVGAATDITARKQVEETLRASEERFALAEKGASDGLYDWDIQNDTLYWSPRFKELLGYAEDELEVVNLGTFESHLHPDDRERIKIALEAHLKDRVPYNVEERLRTKSGEYRWFNARGQALWDEAGNPIRMTGHITDITELKQAEEALRKAHEDLERYAAGLERRTVQLQLAAEVSRAAGSILNPDELIQQVVNLVRERFDLYYVGLFLVDESGRWAVLRAGTGEAGQKMLEQGHRLEVGGTSMIGWCVANKQARIALDVGEEAVRFDNPLLPETRSELALPLISRGQVIGAMTIQSAQPAAFSEEDITVLQTMADQLAIAIENARLFEQTQATLAELETAQRLYVREQWTEYVPARVAPHYERTQPGVSPLGEVGLPEIEQAVAQRELLVRSSPGDGAEPAVLVAPISLRGEVIGVLGLQDTENKRQWTDEEIALIEAVAEQMALALENARLLEQTQRRAARDRLLAEITARVRSSLDPQTILRTAVRELGAALGTDRAFVQIGMDTPAQSVRPTANRASSEEQEP